ncbi:signal transducing kinase of the PAK, partial [Lunasporangiospora selenospora]
GLPKEWQQLLQESGISKQDQAAHPQAVIDIIGFYTDSQEGKRRDEVWEKFGHKNPAEAAAAAMAAAAAAVTAATAASAAAAAVAPSSSSSSTESLKSTSKSSSSSSTSKHSSKDDRASRDKPSPPQTPANRAVFENPRTPPTPAPRKLSASDEAPTTEAPESLEKIDPIDPSPITPPVAVPAQAPRQPPPKPKKTPQYQAATPPNPAPSSTSHAPPKRREKKQEKDSVSSQDVIRRLQAICTDADPTKLYRSLVKIGQGASGGVYTAYQVGTNLSVAIKQMNLEQQPKKDLIINEILVMKESSHKNIVNYIDSFLYRGDLWVVMEYMEGGSLTEVVTTNEMADPQIGAVCRETLLGLEHLHSKGVIHRDIKSDNVLLSLNGDIKL